MEKQDRQVTRPTTILCGRQSLENSKVENPPVADFRTIFLCSFDLIVRIIPRVSGSTLWFQLKKALLTLVDVNELALTVEPTTRKGPLLKIKARNFFISTTWLQIMASTDIDLYKLIQDCPNFPKQGVLFRDISPVFRNIKALNYIADEFERILKNHKFDIVAGIEARGFVTATVLALRFEKGITMIRKAGKLPGETIRKSYDIEYGSAIMEIQKDAIKQGQTVLIVDDLIATGGTALAAAELVNELHGKIAAFAFVIELADLHGATKLKESGHEVYSLAVYN